MTKFNPSEWKIHLHPQSIGNPRPNYDNGARMGLSPPTSTILYFQILLENGPKLA